MKTTMKNATHIEGLLYQHSLALKTSGENSKNPGTQFINGTIDVVTDNAMTNIVTVHFTYVTAKTAKGNANATFDTLQNIINGTYCSVMEHGADKAVKLRIDSAIGLNEFYSNRSGKEELVSVKRNEGGFVHVAQTLRENENERNTFDVDMIITNVRRVEGDDERGRPEQVKVKGCIFDFRKALLPVEFTVLRPDGMDYFENLEASPNNPCFTRVQGNQVSQTTIVRTEEPNAFGGVKVTETPYTNRDYVITWAAAEPYVWDDESTITANELKTAMADREVALATIKQRQDEYRASQAPATPTPAPAAAAATGFNF